MFFTQEDYRKIEEWLLTRTVKDTQFPHADPLRGDEDVPIIQDGKNKTLTINELVKQVAMMELPDFFNVTTFIKRGNLLLEEAINCVPVDQRKLGLTITFHSAKGNWLIYQFKGTSLNQWSSLNYWRSPIEEALEELVIYPDEEDVTGIRDGNRTFLKFRDKDYDPADFSGMGRIMLRKNLVGTDACSIDDEDHLLNVLTQDMIREENTVYIIQYDFDLNGKVIFIPKGCTLWFQGGSINNGTVYLQETAILGVFEFDDIGNVRLFGQFNTGQIMTFTNDHYKAKEDGYFIANLRGSSATPEEDPRQDREVTFTRDPNAYVTTKRQELRWWNGEEWLLILDITDYNELRSITGDLIGKHNAEMSACYKYFKTRCYALENDVSNKGDILENHGTQLTELEHNITGISNSIEEITQRITNLSDIISNLDQTIETHIEQYISNNIIGTTSITVNGQEYRPDANGNIVLPDYPEIEAPIISAEIAPLTFKGAVNEVFDGKTPKEITIPSPTSLTDLDTESLVIKNASGENVISYNAKEAKEVQLKKLHIKTNLNDNKANLPSGVTDTKSSGSLIPYDVDLLKGEGVIDLTKTNFGTNEHGIVLASGYVRREPGGTLWGFSPMYKHPFVTVTVSQSGNAAVLLTVNSAENNNNIFVHTAIASYSSSSELSENFNNWGTYRSGVVGLRCGVVGREIYVQGIRSSNENNDSINIDPAAVGGKLFGFNILIIGHINR